MRTFDCFPFNHELDLLEIRLHTLNNHVDFFVLCEAERSYSNIPKPLLFQEHKHEPRFKPFLDKIIHIPVPASAFSGGSGERGNWKREKIQRTIFFKAVRTQYAKPNDLILFSDIDEIPTPNAMKQFKPPVTVVINQFHYFFFNVFIPNVRSFPRLDQRMRYTDPITDWLGTRICLLKDIPSFLALRKVRTHMYRPWFKPFRQNIFQPSVLQKFPHLVRNGGKHFFGVFNHEDIMKKYQSSSHPYMHDLANAAQHKGLSVLEFLKSEGQRRERNIVAEPLNDTYPPYILQNQEKYKNFIYPVDKPTVLYNHSASSTST